MAGLTRREQHARTRERLLDATVDTLVEHGYSGTTTQRIQDAAGVSRGALLHHFGSKSELLVAALHHIAELRLSALDEAVPSGEPERGSLRAVVAAIRQGMAGPAFQAALELWAAARTDPDLRAALLPAERRLGAQVREVFGRYAGIDDARQARLAFESLMALVRGLELTRSMRSDPAVADEVVEGWLLWVEHLRS